MQFFVVGRPIPQGSKKIGRYGGKSSGRPIIIDDNGAALSSWRKTVTLATQANRAYEAFDGPVSVELVFNMRCPQRPKHVYPTTRPDVDKLARSVLDSLTDAGAWKDDSQVTRLAARKVYAPDGIEGVMISISKETEKGTSPIRRNNNG